MNHAKDTVSDYIPTGPGPSSFTDAVSRDPIATLWSLIRAVCTFVTYFKLYEHYYMQICASSLCQQYFSDVLNSLEQKDLQLLCDVDTRWSSTLLMVEHALIFRLVSILSHS